MHWTIMTGRLYFTTGGEKGDPGPSNSFRIEKSSFLTNAHSRFASVVLDIILRPLCLSRYKLTMFLVLCNSRNKSQVPLKGTVSAQKAIQGSETEIRELLEGTEQKSYSLTRGYQFTSRKVNIFYLPGFPNAWFKVPSIQSCTKVEWVLIELHHNF